MGISYTCTNVRPSNNGNTLHIAPKSDPVIMGMPYTLHQRQTRGHKSCQLSCIILLKSGSGVKYYVLLIGFHPILLNLYRDACTTHMIDRYYSTCFVNVYGLTILKLTSWRDRRTVQLGLVCVQVWTGSLNTSEFTDLVISQTSG